MPGTSKGKLGGSLCTGGAPRRNPARNQRAASEAAAAWTLKSTPSGSGGEARALGRPPPLTGTKRQFGSDFQREAPGPLRSLKFLATHAAVVLKTGSLRRRANHEPIREAGSAGRFCWSDLTHVECRRRSACVRVRVLGYIFTWRLFLYPLKRVERPRFNQTGAKLETCTFGSCLVPEMRKAKQSRSVPSSLTAGPRFATSGYRARGGLLGKPLGEKTPQ